MEEVTLVGIELGKHSFHLHAQDRKGKEVFRRKVTRRQLVELFANFPTCTIAMEACAGAHFMARTLGGFGHQIRLIAPHLVRPFVKSNKNDFADAEAICEAASRPSMRFVTSRTEPQQILSALHLCLIAFGTVRNSSSLRPTIFASIASLWAGNVR